MRRARRCADRDGKVVQGAKRFGIEGSGALLTKILIGINVAVFLWQVGSGGALSNPVPAIRTCTAR